MAQQNTLPSLSGGADGLSRYMEEIRRFPMLQPDEEYMLAKRYHEHDDTDHARSPSGLLRLRSLSCGVEKPRRQARNMKPILLISTRMNDNGIIPLMIQR